MNYDAGQVSVTSKITENEILITLPAFMRQ